MKNPGKTIAAKKKAVLFYNKIPWLIGQIGADIGK